MQELMMVVLVPITEKIQILVGVSSGVDPEKITQMSSRNGVKGNISFINRLLHRTPFIFLLVTVSFQSLPTLRSGKMSCFKTEMIKYAGARCHHTFV